MSYASITRDDPNPLKRWIQSRRLDDALRLAATERLDRVVDYGAGDGEFAVRLIRQAGAREVLCFEPATTLRAEATSRLCALGGARLVSQAQDLPDGWAQVVVCLEVFEHLPQAETEQALAHIHRVLAPGGALIVGAPIEVGPVALAKGAFRRLRRPTAPDARWREIMLACIGRPSTDRQMIPLVDGLSYYGGHLGFDHRALVRSLRRRFEIERKLGSPLAFLPAWLQSELYLVARKPQEPGPA